MSDDTGSKIGRFIVTALLMLGTLGFGLAGLCGAAFTVIGLSSLSTPGPENYAAAALVIAVPSLLIGGGLAWLCVHLYRRRRPDDKT